MNNKLNHKCIVCSKLYNACDDCVNTKTFTPWRTICDTIEHYQIYMMYQDVIRGDSTKTDLKELINRLNISDEELNTFVEPIKNILIDEVELSKSLTEENIMNISLFNKKMKKNI